MLSTECRKREGPWGIALKQSGFDAIIVHGAAAAPVSLVIDNGAVKFADARGLWGKNVGETNDALEAEFGKDINVAAIGQAGENRVRFASIVADRTFQAQRMGMGAVMGSKHLKAVILRGGTLPALAHPDAVAAITEDFGRRIAGNPLLTWQKQPPGFAVWIYTHGIDAALDIENYRTAHFPAVENYKDEEFLKQHRGFVACSGCPNDCIKVLHVDDAELDPRASGIHLEWTLEQ